MQIANGADGAYQILFIVCMRTFDRVCDEAHDVMLYIINVYVLASITASSHPGAGSPSYSDSAAGVACMMGGLCVMFVYVYADS